MRYCKIITLLVFSSTFSFSQKPVIGKVIDSETKRPIQNANIKIVGSQIETTTNSLGFFQLALDSGATIKITCSGYETGYGNVQESNILISLMTQKKPFEDSHFYVSPQIVKELKRILNEKQSALDGVFFRLPFPWQEDGDEIEIETRRKNKVKSIHTKEFHVICDEKGFIVQDEYFKEHRLMAHVIDAGRKSTLKRNHYSDPVLITDTFSDKSYFITQYYYSADTVFSVRSFVQSMGDVGIFYKNIYIEHRYSTNLFSLTWYKKELLPNGYSITVYGSQPGENELQKGRTYIFNKDNLIAEWTSKNESETIEYNSDKLKTRCDFYEHNKLKDRTTFKRNAQGLIVERIQQKFTDDGYLSREKKLEYKYEFFE
jgi:hypothetical protein